MKRPQISRPFVDEQFEILWKRLKKWFNNVSSKHPVTKEFYIELAEARGQEPDWDRCPPGLEDFPYDVQKAIIAYAKFPDRYDSEGVFIGKDYALFKEIIEVELVDDKGLFLESLLQIDSLFIKKSRDDAVEARKQAKRGK